MRKARIVIEQVYHNVQDVRDILDALREVVPFPGSAENTQSLIRMSGSPQRHSGLDDWYADLEFLSEISEQQLDGAIADLPFTHGISYQS